jgi:ankyrin repeat/IBR domain-containing protein 1
MGGTQSKAFFRALKDPNEERALSIYRSSEELRANLNPNHKYGIFARSVTPLHLVAKRGFLELFKSFMINGGSPTYLDGRNKTVAHHICLTSYGTLSEIDRVRADMLKFLIDICTDPSSICPDKELPRHLLDLNKQDRALNTPLHLAAGSGLIECAKILINHGAVVHIINIAGQTPFNAAELAGHTEIMKLLEPKMVFTITPETAMIGQKPSTLRLESYIGMPTEDMKAIKNEIVTHCAAILDVPALLAEQLLQHYSWSQQLLIDSWLDDPVNTCKVAKVQLPANVEDEAKEMMMSLRQISREERICEICGDVCLELTSNTCGHKFCNECWQEYLRHQINQGKVVNIKCPGYQCDDHVSQELVIKLLPTELDNKFSQFNIKTFIESHPHTRYCPHPGCERAIHLKLLTNTGGEESTDGNNSTSSSGVDVILPRNVDCGIGHFFCWSCSEDAHDPCSCEIWKAWKERIQSIEADGLEANIIKASSEAYVAKHSKPCPKCKRPIQRSDGCNHMTCSQCHHDFCWVCLGRWYIHGSRTGGYYSCNRYRTAKKVSDHLEAMQKKAESESNKKNTRYFKHVYSRYKNHMESFRFEEQFLSSIPEKMNTIIANALANSQRIHHLETDDKFAKDAIRELLKSRVVLRSSYALSYYIDSDSARDNFIKIVAPLEQTTESLAQIIARPHLSTPKDKIILATIESREIRRHFLEKARDYNVKLVPEMPPSDDEDDPRDDDDDDNSSYHSGSDDSYFSGDNDEDLYDLPPPRPQRFPSVIRPLEEDIYISIQEEEEEHIYDTVYDESLVPPAPPPPPLPLSQRQEIQINIEDYSDEEYYYHE